MKRNFFILTTLLIFITPTILSQTSMKEYKVGHVIYVSLPEYMTKTVGLNDAAVFQFKNSVKDIAGIIIDDNKGELEIASMKYASINDFYDDFIKDFLIKEKKRSVSQPNYQTIGENKIVDCDVTYYDKDSKMDIYYFIGIVETKDSFYKLLCWGTLESKDKYKADFQKILYSIKD